MALRGKKPEERTQRLKLLLSGAAGVGKTTAAIQMPRPYIIDTEAGSTHYGDIIEKAGGVVYSATDVDDVIAEVRSLYTENHDYLTLVIDPITTLFNNAVDDAERRVGNDFGRHYGEANKKFKRLCGLLTSIDMNVIVTAHEKNEYGEDMKVVGKTFDGFKKLDYIFDLWLQLSRERGKSNRTASVSKTRLIEFPDQAEFPWTYEAIAERFGKERLEKGTQTKELATPEQVGRFNALLNRLDAIEQKQLGLTVALTKLGDPEDWPQERMAKCLENIDKHLNAPAVA